IKKQQLYGLWNTSLTSLLDKVRKQYSPVPKQYQAQVVAIELPTTEVKPGETVVGSITLKNTGETGLYPDTISEIIGSFKSGPVSKFYLPEFWASTSQFSLLADDGVLLPGSEKKFDFRLNVPLYFGSQTEEFELKTVGGQKVIGGDFAVTLNVGRPDGVTVVEVGSTETGWLRVRATASSAAAEVARISTGERYYQIGDAGNGWVQLRLTDGREGWVSKRYLIYP
ncbi:SH3 domain-containing protein, partial [Candidatus Dojkabacteria bacterium]|nr:SH3 domain-containing protein [Candidatus Dojkabacteria bacterium]